jgi:VanZ family protein
LNARKLFPPLIWAGVIVTATSIPSSQLQLPAQAASLDKLVHFGLYSVFAWLLARHGFGVAGRWWATALAVIVASAFGVVDEWHQQYIPGRSTEYADWVADTAGAAVGALSYALFNRRRSTQSTTS